LPAPGISLSMTNLGIAVDLAFNSALGAEQGGFYRIQTAS